MKCENCNMRFNEIQPFTVLNLFMICHKCRTTFTTKNLVLRYLTDIKHENYISHLCMFLNEVSCPTCGTIFTGHEFYCKENTHTKEALENASDLYHPKGWETRVTAEMIYTGNTNNSGK